MMAAAHDIQSSAPFVSSMPAPQSEAADDDPSQASPIEQPRFFAKADSSEILSSLLQCILLEKEQVRSLMPSFRTLVCLSSVQDLLRR